jgi:Ca-activated chloride channel homolog
MRRTRTVTVVSAAVAMSLLASCAGDDSSDAGTAPATSESTRAQSGDTTETTAAAEQGEYEEASEESGDSSYAPATTTTVSGGSSVTAVDPGVNPTLDPLADAVSSFALDVDTGSYSLARAQLLDGYLPDPAAIRTEEFVNAFDQGWPQASEPGLSVNVDGARLPFRRDGQTYLMRIGVQGQDIDRADRRPASLTFVVDTSGSMEEGGRLELVKDGLRRLTGALGSDDRVAIVSFSDAAEVVLFPTSIAEGEDDILDAIDSLRPDASTNVQEGLRLGYDLAGETFRAEGINRVILASDGVANTGATTVEEILESTRRAADRGIQLVSVGVGLGNYSDAIMEQLANQGDGFYAYLDTIDQAEQLFVSDLTTTLQSVAKDAKAEVRFDPALVAEYRQIGFENRAVPDGSVTDPTVDGGELGAGHESTAIYEVTLTQDGMRSDDPLATVTLAWTDPDTGDLQTRAATVRHRDLDVDLAEAAPRLRLDVVVVAFAEHLRGAPWGDISSLGAVRERAAALPGEVREDPDVRDLLDLIDRAARLGG